jgi:hypothetical protein
VGVKFFSLQTLVLTAATVFAVCCGLSVPARAITYPVPGTYLITGTLSDGTTVSGEFTIDVYGYLYPFTSITTLPGTFSDASTAPGQTYAIPGSYVNTYPGEIILANGYSDNLVIAFQNPIGTPGIDPIVLGLPNSFECNCFLSDTNAYLSGPERYFTAGDIVATPLPVSWVMLLSGFVGLALFAFRGAKSSAATAAA